MTSRRLLRVLVVVSCVLSLFPYSIYAQDITGDDITDGSITAADLAAGAVTTQKIRNGAVTETKLARVLLDRLEALETKVRDLEAKLVHVTSSNNEVVIKRANLRIVNGTGDTGDTSGPNGLGNVIIGYNERRGDGSDPRTGSHMLVVGSRLGYEGYGGVVVGIDNNTSGAYASVTGGTANRATNDYASVSGGANNTASGIAASVCGGIRNTARGESASVSGGGENTVDAFAASISGGRQSMIRINGRWGSISGGANNTVTADVASVSGGRNNDVHGRWSSVSGGNNNDISNIDEFASATGNITNLTVRTLTILGQ